MQLMSACHDEDGQHYMPVGAELARICATQVLKYVY